MKFVKSLEQGKEAVELFKQFLTIHKVEFREATQEEQDNDIDIVTPKETYEVKNKTYKFKVVIEEASTKGEGSGWIYTSKATKLIEIDCQQKKLMKLDMKKLRDIYNLTKNQHELHYNKEESDGIYGDKWRSSYRKYHVNELKSCIESTYNLE